MKVLDFIAYGGEPLLNKPALLAIAKQMQTYCQQRGIKWVFGMVSNGSLLNKKTVLELMKYGFAYVQVTIDGNKETHDKRRPFLNDEGRNISTYDITMGNLVGYAGLIHTDVLCVVDESNIKAAHELIDTLADKGLAEKQVRMKVSPVESTYDEKTITSRTRNFAENPHLLEAELEMADALTKLQIHGFGRGLIDDVRPHSTWCPVIRANEEYQTITPDGKRYSCALLIGRGEPYENGSVSAPQRGEIDRLMDKFTYPDECKKCTYLPICPNCRADALEKRGDLLGANSQKAYFDLVVPQLIKAHFERRHQPTT